MIKDIYIDVGNNMKIFVPFKTIFIVSQYSYMRVMGGTLDRTVVEYESTLTCV
jgi:hypothetical protein